MLNLELIKKRAEAWEALPQPCPDYVIREQAEALAEDVPALVAEVERLQVRSHEGEGILRTLLRDFTALEGSCPECMAETSHEGDCVFGAFFNDYRTDTEGLNV